ncbi:hypothetical protein AB5I41_10170 [Sphingomonas sp. MMS24-JH45]
MTGRLATLAAGAGGDPVAERVGTRALLLMARLSRDPRTAPGVAAAAGEAVEQARARLAKGKHAWSRAWRGNWATRRGSRRCSPTSTGTRRRCRRECRSAAGKGSGWRGSDPSSLPRREEAERSNFLGSERDAEHEAEPHPVDAQVGDRGLGLGVARDAPVAVDRSA